MRIAIAGCGQLAGCWPSPDGNGPPVFFYCRSRRRHRLRRWLGLICTWDVHTPINELYDALGKPDVVTIEKEHVDITLMEGLAEHCLVAPSPTRSALSAPRQGKDAAAIPGHHDRPLPPG